MKNLLLTIDDIGNPFDDNSNDLFDLESRVVVPDNLVSNLYKIETVGTRGCLCRLSTARGQLLPVKNRGSIKASYYLSLLQRMRSFRITIFSGRKTVLVR